MLNGCLGSYITNSLPLELSELVILSARCQVAAPDSCYIDII